MPLLLHLVGCLYYLYQRCTVKQISDNEAYLLIKYIKSVLWGVAKCLSYIEDARCLKVNVYRDYFPVVKRPARVVDHPPPSNAPIRLHSVYGFRFCFTSFANKYSSNKFAQPSRVYFQFLYRVTQENWTRHLRCQTSSDFCATMNIILTITEFFISPLLYHQSNYRL